MRLVRNILPLAGGLALMAAWLGDPAAAATGSTKIGTAAVVVNAVAGVDPTQRIVQLNPGNEVYIDEVINTGSKSASRMQFLDNTVISIGADSQVVLDKFVYDPDPSKSKVVVSIARGVIRFATGTMVHAAYTLKTPTATIGVRGTIFSVLVGLHGETTISVDSGGVTMTADGREVLIEPGFFSTAREGSPPTPPAPVTELPPQVTQMNSMINAAVTGDKPGRVKARFLIQSLPSMEAGKITLVELLSKGAASAADVVARAGALIKELDQSNVGADPVALQTSADLILQTAAKILASLPGLLDEQRKDAEAQIEAAIADLLSRIATAAGPQQTVDAQGNPVQPVPNPAISASAN